jgi:hypothetical protein
MLELLKRISNVDNILSAKKLKEKTEEANRSAICHSRNPIKTVVNIYHLVNEIEDNYDILK